MPTTSQRGLCPIGRQLARLLLRFCPLFAGKITDGSAILEDLKRRDLTFGAQSLPPAKRNLAEPRIGPMILSQYCLLKTFMHSGLHCRLIDEKAPRIDACSLIKAGTFVDGLSSPLDCGLLFWGWSCRLRPRKPCKIWPPAIRRRRPVPSKCSHPNNPRTIRSKKATFR